MRVAHAPGMPGRFFLPRTSKETVSERPCHDSRHVCHARAVMHVGIANSRWRGKIPGIPSACATRNSMYLARRSYWSKSDWPDDQTPRINTTAYESTLFLLMAWCQICTTWTNIGSDPWVWWTSAGWNNQSWTNQSTHKHVIMLSRERQSTIRGYVLFSLRI